MRKLGVATFALCCLIPAYAQNVMNVGGVASRSTVMFTDGEYKACGIRFVGLDVDASAIRFPAYGFDFNVSMMKFGTSLGMVLKTELTQLRNQQDLMRASGPLVKVRSTWLQPEGRDPWKAVKTGIAGENGLSSMSTYNLTPGAFQYLLDIADGEDTRLLLGVRAGPEGSTRVYRFQPQLQKEDADAFRSCAKAMIDQSLKDAERK